MCTGGSGREREGGDEETKEGRKESKKWDVYRIMKKSLTIIQVHACVYLHVSYSLHDINAAIHHWQCST